MNILVYPMYSVETINADSNYVIAMNIIRGLSEHNFFLLIDKNRKFFADQVPDNCKILFVDMEKSKRRQVINFQTKTIYRIINDFPIDLILNNVPEQGSNFKYFNTAQDENYQLKVINYHHYNIHPSFAEQNYQAMKHILYAQVFGSLDVDINYFHSMHSYRMFEEEALKLLKDDIFGDIPIHIELAGQVDMAFYKTHVAQYELTSFIYNHRLAGYKDYKKTFEMFDRLWDRYPNQFQVIVTCGDNNNENLIIQKPYVKLKSLKDYSLYIEELRKCHANVTNSHHETYCIAIAESMQADHVIIAPRRATFPELLGEDYPYLFESDDQQFAMMSDLIKNNIRSYKHKEDLSSARIAEIIRNLIETHGQYKPVLENIRKKHNAEKLKSMDLNSKNIRDIIRIMSDLGYGVDQSFPTCKISVMMRELGYVYNLKRNLYEKALDLTP